MPVSAWMSAIATAPAVATVRHLDFSEQFRRLDRKTLATDPRGPDTGLRSQAFSSVSRPRNLEGPVPGPGIGRIGSSPALRTAAHAGLTKRIEPCSPDGRLRGTFPKRTVRFTRYPNPRRYPYPTD